MKKIILTILLVLFSTQPLLVMAAETKSIIGLIPCSAKRDASDPSPTPSGLNCNSWQDLIEVIQALIGYAFIIATVLATISFAYAGWLYLTSNGNTGQVEKGHKIFLKVLQGFVVIALAYLLVKLILTGIAKTDYSLLE